MRNPQIYVVTVTWGWGGGFEVKTKTWGVEYDKKSQLLQEVLEMSLCQKKEKKEKNEKQNDGNDKRKLIRKKAM